MTSSPNPTPGDEPRTDILLVGASVGAGHMQAARALQAWLNRLAPDVTTRLVDSLDFARKTFRRKYAGGYELLVTRLPWVYGLGYLLTDRPRGLRRTLLERRRLWNERRACRKLTRLVDGLAPRLIVHTHFLAPPVLDRHFLRTGRRVEQVIVPTDVIPHRWWYCERAASYFPAHEAGRQRLLAHGIDPGLVHTTGMPVEPKWTDPLPDPAELRTAWSLPEDKPIVLLSGGTEFVCGPIVRIARNLAESCRHACIVVLTGRNKTLASRLARLREVRDGRIVPVAFTDRLHELAHLASLILTKPGGMTTAECLARNLPMLFLRPVPGQERLNAEFFQRHGCGTVARNAPHVVRQAEHLLHHTDELDAMARSTGDLFAPGGQAIAHQLLRKLSKPR